MIRADPWSFESPRYFFYEALIQYKVLISFEIRIIAPDKYLSVCRSTFALTFGTTRLIECYTMHHNSLHVTFLNCPSGPSGNSPRFFARFSALVPQDRRPAPPLRPEGLTPAKTAITSGMIFFFLENQLTECASDYFSSSPKMKLGATDFGNRFR